MAMKYVRDDILRMEGYTPGEQPPPGKFLKLNTNENPYPPSPAVIQAIQTAAEQGLQRYPDPLATAFRMRAAEVLGVDADWILCGNGSDDILTIVTRAFVPQGSYLRYPHPSYVLYGTLAQIQGALIDEVDFHRDWSLGDEFVHPKDNLRLAFLANPNSPSGTSLSPQDVLHLAERLPCPLLVDEAYADFAGTNCLSLVAESEKILVSRTLSKSYALAGLRFGFLVAQPHVIRELAKVKDSYNCDALAIAGATAAIDQQAWLAETRTRIVEARERAAERLRAMGFTVPPSQANFLWCTDGPKPAAWLYERLKENHVLVRYMNYSHWGDGLRITIGTDEQMDVCLTLLDTLLGEHPR